MNLKGATKLMDIFTEARKGLFPYWNYNTQSQAVWNSNENRNNSMCNHKKSRTTSVLEESALENDINPFKEVLGVLRTSNLNRTILAHLKINPIINKFDLFKESIRRNIDIFMISETKIDDSFPARQFYIDGYTPPHISNL